MSCEYCHSIQDELYLLTLPCGYLVCYNHIKPQETLFKCLICQDHLIVRKCCFQMGKNRKKLDEIEFLEQKESILQTCDKIDILKKDINSSINEHSSDVISQIDLKRELLKNEFNELVDHHHQSLLKEFKNFESRFFDQIEPQIKEINTEQIRTYLSQSLDDKDIKSKNNYLSELKIKQFDELFIKLENFKSIKFIEEQKKINIFSIYGWIDSKENIYKLDTFNLVPFKPADNLDGRFGLYKFEELSTGELISTSHAEPSNLLIISPNKEEKTIKSSFNSEIIFLFKAENDAVVTISSDYRARIYQNGIVLRSFMYPKIKIKLADVFLKHLFTLDKNFCLTKREILNGKTNGMLHLEEMQAFSIKALTDDIVLVGYENKIVRRDFGQKKQIDLYETSSKVLTIESINGTDFVYGCDNGKIGKFELTTFGCVQKSIKGHNGAIFCIQICNDGNILSFCPQDETIKLWNSDNFNPIYQLNSKNAFFGKILKSSKLVYLDPAKFVHTISPK